MSGLDRGGAMDGGALRHEGPGQTENRDRQIMRNLVPLLYTDDERTRSGLQGRWVDSLAAEVS
jgi:hypothetical protein